MEKVQFLRERYPAGTRLVLVRMDDPYAPVPAGTRGTVLLVDDMGTLHMDWDNGRTLGIIPGVDSFRRLTSNELLEEAEAEGDGISFTTYAFFGGELDGQQLSREEVEEICEGYTADNTQKRAMGCLCPRKELDSQPTVAGYCGPMWDGVRYILEDGTVKYDFDVLDKSKVRCMFSVLRYETQEVYDRMGI